MRQRRWLIIVALCLGLAGCAGTKPCLVIPAQLELARDTRDAAKATMDEKTKEMDRWQNAIKQSEARIDRLKEDRDQLQQELDILEPDETGTAKEEKK